MRLPVRLRLAAAALTLSAATAAPWAAHATEVAGVKLQDSLTLAGKELKLNGAGVRTRFVFKVYAVGFYLGNKAATTDAVLAAPGPRRVQLVMLREVSSDDFSQAVMGGLDANVDKAERAKIAAQVTKLGEIFKTVGALKKGDTLTLDWLPEKGTQIELNGKSLSEPLPDLAFYNALLRIWIGDKPADTALKPLLLGQPAGS